MKTDKVILGRKKEKRDKFVNINIRRETVDCGWE